MTTVLLAPDKFKGTLSGGEVAAALAVGIRHRRPQAELIALPVADGGDGFLDVFLSAGFERVRLEATDAGGHRCETWYARRGTVAVIELAKVAGLARAHADLGVPHDPMRATSRGVGELVAHALDAGCRELLVGIGGSASSDGGVGLVQALGARVLDRSGAEVVAGAYGAAAAARLDLAGLHPGIFRARITVACDVDNPLTGPLGAASVYGPQKGVAPDQVALLDRALRNWAALVAVTVGRDHRLDPGAGAAGGVGFAAGALLRASLRPGAQMVVEQLGLNAALQRADLVITGEGSLDAQTLRGKAPAVVAAAGRACGVPVIAVAGRCLLDVVTLQSAGFDSVYTLMEEAHTPRQALDEPAALLESIGTRVGDWMPHG